MGAYLGPRSEGDELRVGPHSRKRAGNLLEAGSHCRGDPAEKRCRLAVGILAETVVDGRPPFKSRHHQSPLPGTQTHLLRLARRRPRSKPSRGLGPVRQLFPTRLPDALRKLCQLNPDRIQLIRNLALPAFLTQVLDLVVHDRVDPQPVRDLNNNRNLITTIEITHTRDDYNPASRSHQIGPISHRKVDALLRARGITGGLGWLIDMLALTRLSLQGGAQSHAH